MRTGKIDPMALALALNERGLKAETFNNGMHWRITGKHIDLYPTTGNWKWMSKKHSGGLYEFLAFLDTLAENEKILSQVITRRG